MTYVYIRRVIHRVVFVYRCISASTEVVSVAYGSNFTRHQKRLFTRVFECRYARKMYINTATYVVCVSSRQSSCLVDLRVETMASRLCIVLLCLLSAIMYCSGRFAFMDRPKPGKTALFLSKFSHWIHVPYTTVFEKRSLAIWNFTSNQRWQPKVQYGRRNS